MHTEYILCKCLEYQEGGGGITIKCILGKQVVKVEGR